MDTNVLIKAILEAVKENTEKDNVTIITSLFTKFKKEKDDNFDDFKEFINSRECLCHIKGYLDCINSLSEDEIKQVIANSNITKEDIKAFVDICTDKINRTCKELLDSAHTLENNFINNIEKPNLEDLSKEELIDIIKNKK